MYSTCLFCNKELGSNEVIENFPIGRRLAYDEAKGRLWVVCRRFEKWNLTPLEERWEAIEECERFFRDTPPSEIDQADPTTFFGSHSQRPCQTVDAPILYR